MYIRSVNRTAGVAALILLVSTCFSAARSQSLAAQSAGPQNSNTNSGRPAAAPAATLPKDYVIGVEDILSVVFWRDKDLSGDVAVRPDGKISLPMLNDVPAAGLTPEQLAA